MLNNTLVAALYNKVEELVFRPEVLENKGFRNARRFGNKLRRGVVVTFLPKQLQRHVGNVLAAGNHGVGVVGRRV